VAAQGKPVVTAPIIEAIRPRQRNGTIPALAVADDEVTRLEASNSAYRNE
jgi:hypothetical protein